MDIVSAVFTQLFAFLILGAIIGIIWFAYQANLQQQQKTSRGARGGEKKERDRKQPKNSRHSPAPVPEPEADEKSEEESEAEAEPEPVPEPEPAKKGKKNNKKKPAEEKKAAPAPEKKPQAKAAPVQAAPAKKAAQKGSSAPTQKAPAAAAKKPVEEKEAKPVDQKKKDKNEKKKKLQESQAQFEASLAAANLALKKQSAKPDDIGWTETVAKKRKDKESHTQTVLPFTHDKYFHLLGPKGASIQAIREHSGAEVSVEKSNLRGHEKKDISVTIKGTPSNCAKAEALVRELADKRYTSVTHPGFVSISFKLKNARNDRSLLLVNKGANIRKLQERCGVQIVVPRAEEVDGKMVVTSDEVTIIGPPLACKKAAEAMTALFLEGFSKTTHEDHVRQEIEGVPRDQFPALIGRKGERVRNMEKESDTKITIPNDDNGLVNILIVGKEANVLKARDLIYDALSKDAASPVVETNNKDDPWSSGNVHAEEF